MENLAQMGLFMLDMDGTFYLGDRLLPGAKKFLAICKQVGCQHLFLTNNSSKSRQAYVEKLHSLGVETTLDEIFTSGDASIFYLKEKGFDKRLLLVGTQSLCQQFEAAGFDPRSPEPKVVVLGFDTELTYEKLVALCNAVRAGLPYIATHPDFNCPVPGGLIPDIGAVIAFVKAATGREPDIIIGKPNVGIVQAVSAKVGLPPGKLCMVGDRLYTDMALGKHGVHTALVLCGEATRDTLAQSGLAPDFVFENLAEMAQALQRDAIRR